MTVKKALEVLKRRLDEYSERIAKADVWEDKLRWLDQAYGFMSGLETAVDGLYEAIEAEDLWNSWYIANHPAYSK